MVLWQDDPDLTIKEKGELEIDRGRGVIYFHSNKTGQSLLRICRLPAPIPDPRIPDTGMLDIMHLFGASWQGMILSYPVDPIAWLTWRILKKVGGAELGMICNEVVNVHFRLYGVNLPYEAVEEKLKGFVKIDLAEFTESVGGIHYYKIKQDGPGFIESVRR